MKFTTSSVLAFSLPLALAATIPAPSCPATTPQLDPITQAYADATSSMPSLFAFPLPEIRDGYQSNASNPSTEFTTKTLSLPVGPTGNVTAYLYAPVSGERKKGKDLLPVIAYFHGGGWTFGGPKSYQGLVTNLIRETGAAVFFVDYTLNPKAAYPVAIEQCYAAVQWLLEHGEKLGVDPTNMGFGGDSAGGELSASVSLLSIKRKTPLPKYQVLIYPATDLACESATFMKFPNGPGLTVDDIHFAVSLYTPDPKSRLEDVASPMRASDEELAKFPETLIVVAEVDPIRQQGEDFGRRLQKVGARVATIRVLGTIHGFISIDALSKAPAAKATIELIGYKFKKAFW
ncbi:alpha/beta hydrolase fold-domain-containing protein [Tuber brumale]|nr:alpha/beta hydrolase fold-domain-containing protein [Tuber brumale]